MRTTTTARRRRTPSLGPPAEAAAAAPICPPGRIPEALTADRVIPIARLILHSPPGEAIRATESLRQGWPEMYEALTELLAGTRSQIAAACAAGDPDAVRRLVLVYSSPDEIAAAEAGAEARPSDPTEIPCLQLARLTSAGQIFLVFPYATTETFPSLRSEWARYVRGALGGRPQPPGCSVDGLLTPATADAAPTRSDFGETWVATLSAAPEGAYPVDLEEGRLPVSEGGARTATAASELLSQLVTRGVSPNFSIPYSICAAPWPSPRAPGAAVGGGGQGAEGEGEGEGGSRLRQVVIREHADTNMRTLMMTPVAGEGQLLALFSVTVQTLMAIVAMALLDLSHNDLTLENVLVSRMERVWHAYETPMGRYVVPTEGLLAKVARPGQATSPAIGRPHSVGPLPSVRLGEEGGEGGGEGEGEGEGQGANRPAILRVARVAMQPYARDLFAFVGELDAALSSPGWADAIARSEIGQLLGVWARSMFAAVHERADPSAQDGALSQPAGVLVLVQIFLGMGPVQQLLASPLVAPPRGARILVYNLNAIVPPQARTAGG